eukprot:gene1604-1865_t
MTFASAHDARASRIAAGSDKINSQSGLHRPLPNAFTESASKGTGFMTLAPMPDNKYGLALSKAGRTTLLLIEEVRLMRECMASLLRMRCPEIEVHACEHWLGNFDEDQTHPNMILLDLHHNSIDAFTHGDQAHLLHERFRSTPILAISDRDEAKEALVAIDMGLAGFFPMNCSAELLIAAIRLVIAGGRFIPPGMLSEYAFHSSNKRELRSSGS